MCQAQVSLKILGPLARSWKSSRLFCSASPQHTHTQPPSGGWPALGNTLLMTELPLPTWGSHWDSVIAEFRNDRTLAKVT